MKRSIPTEKPFATYKHWIQAERAGFWTNTLTGESTIWHPMAIEIGSPLYKRASKWCRDAADSHNKRAKGK